MSSKTPKKSKPRVLQLPHANKPLVAVVCPTYGRHKFLPWLIKMFNAQTYHQSRMMLIILDDSPNEVTDPVLAKMITQDNVKFVRHTDSKMTIGAKRNKLNQLAIEAGADIIVCADDDDFFPEARVEHSVSMLQKSGAQIAGSSTMYIFFTDDKIIRKFGPYSQFHATNGTFALTRKYAETHKYDEVVAYGEESSFTKNFTEPLVQLDSFKTILCISHQCNTFDKKNIKLSGASTVAKIKDFVKNKELRDFYNNLHKDQLENPVIMPGTQNYAPLDSTELN